MLWHHAPHFSDRLLCVTVFVVLLLLHFDRRSGGTGEPGKAPTLVVAALAVATFLSWKDFGGGIKHSWRDTRPNADTFGLWCTSEHREEWCQVRQALGDSHACLVAFNGGCLELLMPQFADAEDMFLIPGYPTPEEYQRKLRHVSDAEVVLVSKLGCIKPMLELWPEIREAIKDYELVKSTDLFLVYRRRRPSKLGAAEPDASINQ